VKQYRQALLVACLLCGACGGGGGGDRPPSPTPDRPPASPESPTPPGTVIRGGERLGWDQSGPSQTAVQAYTYVLYVDGTSRTLADIRCAAATGSGYPCSGQLPALVAGAHVLELAAVDQGVEGPRSAPFRVTVNLSSSSYTASALAPTSPARVVCLDSAVDECYNALTLATAAGDVTDLTVAADGRAFFVEDGRAVRVIGREGLSPTAALIAPDEGERLVSLALSPDFLENRFVYVGSVEERRAGAEFTVRRYREVGGVLGQGAALVTGLPVDEAGTRVPIAIDHTERMYVALPAADESVARLSAFAFNGHLLRFAPDGSVPADQTSPMLTRGYERPSALVYEPSESRLWLAGSSGTGDATVATISLAGDVALTMTSAKASVRMPAVALRNRGGTLEFWLADGGAYRGTAARGALQRLQSVETGLGELSGIAAASRAELIVVVRQGSSGALGSEIVRLVPRSPALSQ
jgi:hypothetical protein